MIRFEEIKNPAQWHKYHFLWLLVKLSAAQVDFSDRVSQTKQHARENIRTMTTFAPVLHLFTSNEVATLGLVIAEGGGGNNDTEI